MAQKWSTIKLENTYELIWSFVEPITQVLPTTKLDADILGWPALVFAKILSTECRVQAGKAEVEKIVWADVVR